MKNIKKIVLFIIFLCFFFNCLTFFPLNTQVLTNTNYQHEDPYNISEPSVWGEEKIANIVPITYSSLSDTPDLSSSLYFTSSPSSGLSIAKGTLQWKDTAGRLHPLQYMKVIFYIGSLNLISYSNINGQYTINGPLKKNETLKIRICAAGENNTVIDADNIPYYIESREWVCDSAETANFDCTIGMGNPYTLGRAFQVAQAITVAERYAKTMSDNAIENVITVFPHNEAKSGCFYQFSNKSIYITATAYASWDVIQHEYGHHVQRLNNITASPGGTHYISRNMADEFANKPSYGYTFENAKAAAVRLAWGEAWPTVFGILAQNYFHLELQNIDTVGDNIYTSYNGTIWDVKNAINKTQNENEPLYLGEACEASVAAILFKIYGYLGHQEFWDIIMDSQKKTLSDFIQYCYNNKPVDLINLSQMLSKFGMGPSNFRADVTLGLPSVVYWDAGGGSEKYPNNKFQLWIFNRYGILVRKININSSNCQYALTTADKSLINAVAYNGRLEVAGIQTNNIQTGPYTSRPYWY